MNKGKKYKVLYLSYDGMTDPLGQSQVLTYIKGIEKKGFDYDLISFEKEEVFSKREKDIHKLIDGFDINWIPLTYTKQPPILSTIYDVYRLFNKVEALHKENKYELIHCRGYITSLVGLKMKQKHKVPFIFDMRAFYADERVDGGLWNLSNPVYKMVYRFFKKKEKEFIKYAAYTISLTKKGEDIIKSWDILPKENLNIQVIPCCADLDLFDFNAVENKEVSELKNNLGIDSSEKVISYLGSIGTWYMPDEMMLFFKRFQEKNSNSTFLFITGESEEKVKKLAEKYNVPTEKIKAVSVKHSDVPKYLCVGDYALFFIKPVFSKSGSSPTKMAEIMGLGIPLVCNDGVGDVESIVNSTGCGVCISTFDSPTFDNAISKLETTVFDKEKIRKGAFDYYDLNVGVERYLRVYTDILKIHQ